MGVSIDLSGLKVRGNARVMNDVKITGYEDAKIRAENTEIDGNVEFLERLEIGPVLDEVQRQLRNLAKSGPLFGGVSLTETNRRNEEYCSAEYYECAEKASCRFFAGRAQ